MVNWLRRGLSLQSWPDPQIQPGYAIPPWYRERTMSALINAVGLGQIEAILEGRLGPNWDLVAWRIGPPDLPIAGARIALEIDGYALCPLDVFRKPVLDNEIGDWIALLPQESDPLILEPRLSTWIVIRAHGIIPDTPDVPIFPCKSRAALAAQNDVVPSTAATPHAP